MKYKINKWLIPATTSLLFFGACSDDEDEDVGANADYLVGEWELKSATFEFKGPSSSYSYTQEFGVEDSDGYIYNASFEFQADGDMITCNSFEDTNDAANNYSDCYEGEWEWVMEGSKLKFLSVEMYGDTTYTYEQEMNVIKLTKTEFVGGWSYSYEGYNANIEFSSVKK